MRLNKFLAQAGIASRRQADQLIQNRRVSINGKIIQELGTDVKLDSDRVEVDGEFVIIDQQFEYLILNKPPGYLTTVRDPFHRPIVMDLLPECKTRLYPVGRLDMDTSGLLFFTNDGEVALALTHPRHWVEKVYRVTVLGVPDEIKIHQLAAGVLLEDGITAPAKVELEAIETGNAIIRISIREGRKRQIKRMMKFIGHPVIALHRLKMGPLTLGDIKPGESRQPTPQELTQLLELKKQILGI